MLTTLFTTTSSSCLQWLLNWPDIAMQFNLIYMASKSQVAVWAALVLVSLASARNPTLQHRAMLQSTSLLGWPHIFKSTFYMLVCLIHKSSCGSPCCRTSPPPSGWARPWQRRCMHREGPQLPMHYNINNVTLRLHAGSQCPEPSCELVQSAAQTASNCPQDGQLYQVAASFMHAQMHSLVTMHASSTLMTHKLMETCDMNYVLANNLHHAMPWQVCLGGPAMGGCRLCSAGIFNEAQCNTICTFQSS